MSFRGRVVRGVIFLAVIALFGAFTVAKDSSRNVPTSASGATTTSTTVPLERAQPLWTVASRSARGVMVDYRNIAVRGAIFRVVRFRARSTFLRWHVGAGDPNAWRLVPADAGPSIDWSNEGPPGVVGVFNGGFKQGANGGGSLVDHVLLVPLVRGDATLALDNAGRWEMGVWGESNFPTRGFRVISLRQNLVPLVQNGALTSSARSASPQIWGATLGASPLVARSGLGVDKAGNLIYVATMTGVVPSQLAIALLRAGAQFAMQLDINPYWPILGVSQGVLHSSRGVFSVQLPSSDHNANVYDTGWLRDFFVVLAEPSSWNCSWQSLGVRPLPTGAQPQRLREVPTNCAVPPPATASSLTTSPRARTTTVARRAPRRRASH